MYSSCGHIHLLRRLRVCRLQSSLRGAASSAHTAAMASKRKVQAPGIEHYSCYLQVCVHDLVNKCV